MSGVAAITTGQAGELDELIALTMQGLLAPVAAELADETVSEIMINGPDEIYVERGGHLYRTQGRFPSDYDLEATARSIAQFAGKRLSPDEMSVEARLPNGSRVHILQHPASRQGLCIAIRLFRETRRTIDDLVEAQALTAEAADFLRLCVAAHKSIVISGGTGTGKTTMVGALAAFFAEDERIIVIEDVKELSLRKSHVLYFEAQKPDRFGIGGITIRELFRASLRMRPDRIIIGECRGGEALDMIQAMTSGHTGSLSTLHANDPRAALQRLETMALMSEVSIPLIPLRSQVTSAVDIVVQIVRERGRRYVAEIAEVIDLDADGRYCLNTIYEHRLAPEAGTRRLVAGDRPQFARELVEIAQELALPLPALLSGSP